MATDSGLIYLSGLLRAGAEPLGRVGRAPRRRGGAPPRAVTSPHNSSPSSAPPPTDRAHADELPHSLERDTAERVTHTTASQTNTADAFKGHVIPATSEETIFAEQSEHFDAPQASPTNTTPQEDNDAFPSTPFTPPPHASPRPRVAAAAPPTNTDTGIETQPHETILGDAPPSFTSDARPAMVSEHESITPATSRATGAASEARVLPEERRQSRAASEEEIRSDEA
ncbi:MAG TPA: hypothetical protein VFS10_09215, partial [Pyrinomonadaceae bacterium]|nr:hypothetical protein [Pyrinomonadaceae bacterium]